MVQCVGARVLHARHTASTDKPRADERAAARSLLTAASSRGCIRPTPATPQASSAVITWYHVFARAFYTPGIPHQPTGPVRMGAPRPCPCLWFLTLPEHPVPLPAAEAAYRPHQRLRSFQCCNHMVQCVGARVLHARHTASTDRPRADGRATALSLFTVPDIA